MADLTFLKQDPTLEKLKEVMFQTQKDGIRLTEAVDYVQYPRNYLGVSEIGYECARQLWYNFRKCSDDIVDTDSLLRFHDGYVQEEVMALRLKMIPEIKLLTCNDNGEQFGFDMINGHFSGHLDGVIKGILQSPKTWHVWEHKSVGEPNFKKIGKLKKTYKENDLLKAWNPVYYAQAQVYMLMTDLKRHYLTCTTPGGRSFTSIRTKFNKHDAENYVKRAENIINHPIPTSDRVSSKETFYQCNWCNHSDVCYGEKLPNVNCRTCCHSEPSKNENKGKWECLKLKMFLTLEEQLQGCEHHLFIPDFLKIKYEVLFADKEERILVYAHRETGRMLANGLPSPSDLEITPVLSKDLQKEYVKC